MKRFWTETEITADGDNFIVRLDERPVKLPSGKPLAVPFRALAEGIAAEWAAADENFTPDDLPLTRLATTAQERIPAHRSEIVLQLAKYGMNDLLCYRAADEPALALREEEAVAALARLGRAGTRHRLANDRGDCADHAVPCLRGGFYPAFGRHG